LLIENKGTAHIGVFSFLPLKDILSGLNFSIQADFLTTPGRGELARDCLWNNWLADEVYRLIIDKCIPTFLKHDKWKMNIVGVLYSSESVHGLFDTHIKKPLRQYLENNAILVADDGSVIRAEDLVYIEDEVKNLITKDDIQLLYPNKKVISKNCMNNISSDKKGVYDKIIKATTYYYYGSSLHGSLYGFLSSDISNKLLVYKAQMKDIEWFKKIYSRFVDTYDREHFRWYKYKFPQYNVEHDSFWNMLRRIDNPIILTEDYSLAKVSESYTNPHKLDVPSQVKDKIKIVHPEIEKDKKFMLFLKRLNEERYNSAPPNDKLIKPLTEDDIRDVLKKQDTIGLNEEIWNALSDEDKIDKIRYIKNLWLNKYISLENYNFITLKSKSGNWLRPSELILSSEYKPDHIIEVLSCKGLLDLLVDFVDPIFAQNQVDKEIENWQRFFKELGVDTILDDENNEKHKDIVERIAVLTSIEYERKNGRLPKELSEEPGYDIESLNDNEIRYIEAKGASKPSRDIFLTANEYRALCDKNGEYFVYFVTNVFKDPTLNVTIGIKLLEIAPKVIIGSWRSAKVDEFKPLI
jgi:hypothetical protein